MILTDVKLTWLLVVLAIIIACFPINVPGQNIVTADPGDIFDSESIFINPAVISFGHRQVTLGMKVYQWGFLANQDLGLHNSYVSLSLPEAFLGWFDLGLSGQNFSVPLYDQINFSLLLAQRPISRLALGAKYNLFAKSYHKKYFDLVNPDDPVFSRGTLKIAHSFGIGLLLYPYSTFAIGFSCDHLNHPDVSLDQDKFRQPLTYDFGIRYSYTFFSSSIFVNYVQRYWQMNWIFEARPSAFSTFKIGIIQKAAKFSAQFYLLNGISINYGFDYPLYDVNQLSKGSHQISFIYHLDHDDHIKALQYSSYREGQCPLFNLSSQFFVDISANNLEMTSCKIIRKVDKKVTANALKQLTEIELAVGDSCYAVNQFYRHGMSSYESLIGLSNLAKYSKTYHQFLKRITAISRQQLIHSLDVIASTNSMPRAMRLHDSLANRSADFQFPIQIKSSETEPVTKRIEPQRLYQSRNDQSLLLNPDSVVFHISSLRVKKYRGSWRLIISDYSGREIKIFTGKGPIPAEIIWDWRDQEGTVIAPMIYFYYLEWEGKNDQKLYSQPKTFTVTKISRTLEIDVRSEPDENKDQGSKIEIKLAN